MRINKLKLLSKGWSAQEIDHASMILQKAEDGKQMSARFLDKSIYWALLFILIVANIICSAFITPLMFGLKNAFIIIISAALGFVFGVIFSILIIDIDTTEHKNNKKLIFTLVFSGIINFGLIINFAMDFSRSSGLPLIQNPYLIAGIYLFSFLTPHAILTLTRPSWLQY